MHLHSYRVRNYRRLRDIRVQLAQDISIFVGANNIGKTSATHVIEMFASGNKNRFSLFDFSSNVWKQLNDLGDADPRDDIQAVIPAITLDLWLQVDEADLYLVLPLLPSTEWEASQVGLRVEFAAQMPSEMLGGYRAANRPPSISRPTWQEAPGLTSPGPSP